MAKRKAADVPRELELSGELCLAFVNTAARRPDERYSASSTARWPAPCPLTKSSPTTFCHGSRESAGGACPTRSSACCAEQGYHRSRAQRAKFRLRVLPLDRAVSSSNPAGLR
jgi:hypothetical protein